MNSAWRLLFVLAFASLADSFVNRRKRFAFVERNVRDLDWNKQPLLPQRALAGRDEVISIEGAPQRDSRIKLSRRTSNFRNCYFSPIQCAILETK